MNYNSIKVLLTFITTSYLLSGIEGSLLEYALEYTKQDVSTILIPVTFKKTFHVDEDFVKVIVSINAETKGFNDYTMDKASVTPDLRITLDGNIKDASIFGNYNLNGTYYKIIPLLGKGNFNIKFTNFDIYLNTQIVAANGTIQLPYFDFTYDYDQFSVSVEGLTGQADVGAVLQHFLNDFISNILKKREKEISSFIKTYTLTKGNEFLKTATPNSFIELIKVLFVY